MQTQPPNKPTLCAKISQLFSRSPSMDDTAHSCSRQQLHWGDTPTSSRYEHVRHIPKCCRSLISRCYRKSTCFAQTDTIGAVVFNSGLLPIRLDNRITLAIFRSVSAAASSASVHRPREVIRQRTSAANSNSRQPLFAELSACMFRINQARCNDSRISVLRMYFSTGATLGKGNSSE